MSMSGEPILAAERWSAKELLAAGWAEADLVFEQIAERTVEAAARGDLAGAKAEAGAALRLARENFEPIDPRLGTALANFAVCLALSGDMTGNAPLLADARAVWRGAGPWIARMDAPRVARSSLFHMRMELRHRATYRERWRQRWREIAAEVKTRLDALEAGRARVTQRTAEAILAQWRRERPAMLNDTRKLMAAAYLLLAPPAAGNG